MEHLDTTTDAEIADVTIVTDPIRQQLNKILGPTTHIKPRYEALVAWLESLQAAVDSHNDTGGSHEPA